MRTTRAAVAFAAAALAASGALAAAPAPIADATCAGDPGSPYGIVYLHGVDPVEMTEQERGNRDLLTRIAKDEGFAVALLRARTQCQGGRFAGRLCWQMQDKDALEKTLAGVVDAAKPCFRKRDVKRAVVGFSNGGFVANKLVQHCIASPFLWSLSIGSAGQLDKTAPSGTKACGKLQLLIGRKDGTRDSTYKLHRELVRLGREVVISDFDGGHVVPEAETRSLLREFKQTH